jgi:hypothetical protein
MRKPKRKTQREMELEVENWNLKNKVGSFVRVRLDSGHEVETTTRSEAQMLSGHTPVVFLDGISGCYLLDRVTPC